MTDIREWTIQICPSGDFSMVRMRSLVCPECGATTEPQKVAPLAEVERLNAALDAHIGVERSLLDRALVVEPELERLRAGLADVIDALGHPALHVQASEDEAYRIATEALASPAESTDVA